MGVFQAPSSNLERGYHTVKNYTVFELVLVVVLSVHGLGFGIKSINIGVGQGHAEPNYDALGYKFFCIFSI